VKSAIPIILVLLSTSGCRNAPPSPNFGHDRNIDRKRRLLPIIEESWVASTRNDNETTWSADFVTDEDSHVVDTGLPQYHTAEVRHAYGPGAHHTAKTVFRSGGDLLAEEDLYCKSIDSNTHRSFDTLTIRYDYTNPKSPWTCYRNRATKVDELSLSQAEELLRTWRIPRLNYKPKLQARTRRS
jgi:hypothetical protein